MGTWTGAWRIRKVYVITAWVKDFEESGYLEPSEEFYAATWNAAQQKKMELLESDEYEDVWVSSEKKEREVWVEKETLSDQLERAKEIAESEMSQYQKGVELARIMTELEQEYNIPMLRNLEWEQQNRKVIETYRTISNMRSL